MKLALDQVLRAVEKNQFRAFVFYGDDTLVQAVISEVCTVFPSTTVASGGLLDYKASLGVASLFGVYGTVVTLVPQDRNTAATLKIARTWPKGFCLFVRAGSAAGGSLTAPDLAAVPCYSCTEAQSRTFLLRHLHRVGLLESEFTPPAFKTLQSWTSGGFWQQACDLMALCPNRPITMDQVTLLLPPESHEILEVLGSEAVLGRWDLGGHEPVKVVRVWRKFLDQILQAAMVANPLVSKQTLGQVKPPIFFKNETLALALVRAYAKKDLADHLIRLARLEARLKQDSSQAQFWLADFLRSFWACRRAW